VFFITYYEGIPLPDKDTPVTKWMLWIRKTTRKVLLRAHLKVFFTEPGHLSACFSILALVTIALTIAFGFALYNSTFNESIEVTISSYREIPNRDLFDGNIPVFISANLWCSRGYS
jgi:hypothetical protein